MYNGNGRHNYLNPLELEDAKDRHDRAERRRSKLANAMVRALEIGQVGAADVMRAFVVCSWIFCLV